MKSIDIKSEFSLKQLRSLSRLLPPRKFKCYCVGLAKTGTTSISNIFNRFNSRHEYMNNQTGVMLRKRNNLEITEEEFRRYIIIRDISAYCAMDSSSINYLYLDILAEEFPESKFIFTFRDCYSWLDSTLNYLISSPKRLWFNPISMEWHNPINPKLISRLDTQGILHSFVNEALSIWAAENTRILNLLPSGRSLVIFTHRITQEMSNMAKFVGVPSNTLNKVNSHSFQGEYKFRDMIKIDRSFLVGKVKEHCSSLMKKYFGQLSLEEDLQKVKVKKEGKDVNRKA